MDALDGLVYGLAVAFTVENLVAALLGAIAGTAIGVLPGLGPVAGVALVMPASYAFGPTAGLIMMAGIYYGAMYGGSTTAVLINMPGESASVITAIDGFKLTKKGRAGAVLAIMAIGSFIGGSLSVIAVMLFAPKLAEFGLMFGPAEFFALTAGGLLLMSRISGGSLAAGLFPMAIGLALATIGQEAVTGEIRFTFGSLDLAQGVALVALVVGLYGLAEIMTTTESRTPQSRPQSVRLREMWPSRTEWRRSVAPTLRGTVLGFVFGLLPGPSATLSSFASYRLEKAVSKHRDEIGDGAIEGVAGPETANNAAATGSLVPLLALGIPFGSVTALMLAAMIVHGVQPGPMLIVQHPEVFWGVVASMYLGNVMLLVLNLPLIGVWVSLLRVPTHLFMPLILAFAVIGCYSVRNSLLDVWMFVFVGFVGYALRKLDFHLAPLVVGLVLGPEIEKHLREGLYMSQGDVGVFVSGWIAPSIWALVAVVMLVGPLRAFSRRARARYVGVA